MPMAVPLSTVKHACYFQMKCTCACKNHHVRRHTAAWTESFVVHTTMSLPHGWNNLAKFQSCNHPGYYHCSTCRLLRAHSQLYLIFIDFNLAALLCLNGVTHHCCHPACSHQQHWSSTNNDCACDSSIGKEPIVTVHAIAALVKHQ